MPVKQVTVNTEVQAMLVVIHNLRNNHGYTQEQMAGVLGVSTNTYKRIESGLSDLTFKLLAAISAHFDMKTSMLLRDAERLIPCLEYGCKYDALKTKAERAFL